MSNNKAVTRIQAVILVSIILLAAVGGVVGYVLFSGEEQSSEIIKVGILGDLDGPGRHLLQGAVLAAEQINAEGGIAGREVQVFGEDAISGSSIDEVEVSSALTRLITYHNVDLIIGTATDDVAFMCQDIVAEHKKILIGLGSTSDALTQKVLDDYEKYKYYFMMNPNATSIFVRIPQSLIHLREMTGFNKIGYISEELGWTKGIREGLDYVLPELYGFDLVYKGTFPFKTIDFSSYFAAAEAAGVEVLIPLIATSGGIPFAKEYSNRQSPLVIYSGLISMTSVPEGWERTDGKCEYITSTEVPIVVGYPVTSKTLTARQAYLDRWDEIPTSSGSKAYDLVKFILPDAITRAGTIETDAVIEALEQTRIETSQATNFFFTESHGLMVEKNSNDLEADYITAMYFQWQNGEQVPIYPKSIMEEAGATYTYPPWPGPWD